ncbi:MAG TPA: hypothetical protein VI197_06355 [Polyangiaceae bacterium]
MRTLFEFRAQSHTLPNGGVIEIDPEASDERMLQPGVYWYCCSPAEAQEFIRWLNDRTLMVVGVKLLGSNGKDCAVVVFETNGVAYWTLSGLPRLAPQGMATTLEALTKEPSLTDFFRERARQAIEAVRSMDQKIQQWLDGVFR